MNYSPAFSKALAIVGIIALVQTTLTFTLPLLALEIAGTGTGLALIKGVGFVPNILFAIFIGVINDRLRKGPAFRGYSCALFTSVAVLSIAALSDMLSIPALVVFMIVFNGLSYATGNAQMALIRLTVDEDSLSDATALTSTVFAVISTAGPAVAGFALLQLGHTGVIIAVAGLMVVGAVLSMSLDPDETLPPPLPFLPSLSEGIRVFWSNRELVHMTFVIVLTNAAEGAFATGLILKLKTIAFYDDFSIGLVLASAGVGAIAASRVAAPARRFWGYRAAFFWPIFGLAALYLLLIANWSLLSVCLLSFLEGGLSLFFAIGVWSYRQESTEAEHMGRVAGLTGAIFKIGMPPIIIVAGWLTDAGSLTTVFLLAATINIVAAFYLTYVARWGWPTAKA